MNIIEKIIAPTKQHHEEFLTFWIADLENGRHIWVQTSKDIEKPQWERMGDLYEEFVLENKSSSTELIFYPLYLPKRLDF